MVSLHQLQHRSGNSATRRAMLSVAHYSIFAQIYFSSVSTSCWRWCTLAKRCWWTRGNSTVSSTRCSIIRPWLRPTGMLPWALSIKCSGYEPATVSDSSNKDPVRMLPRRSTSFALATMFLNMSARLPAIVISSTGNAISPSSTQNPLAPRE